MGGVNTAQVDWLSAALPVQADYRLPDAPRARRMDPASSHAAADHIQRSGKANEQGAAALAAVRAHPGKTSQELAEKTGQDRYVLARRLPEIEKAGHIKRGVIVECTVTKRKALTWWPK